MFPTLLRYVIQRTKVEWVWNYLNDYHQGYENVYHSKSTSHVSFLVPNSRFQYIITELQVEGKCANGSLRPDIIEKPPNTLCSFNRYVLNKNYFKPGMKYIYKNKVEYFATKLLVMKCNRYNKCWLIVWVFSISNEGSVWVLYYGRRSVGQSVLNKAPIWGLWPDFYYCQDSCWFVDVGRSLWREDGSIVYSCCWPSPAQSFSGPSLVRLATIFYCLRFYTSLFVASYDSQSYGGGILPRLHRNRNEGRI
jgi:hypothetical protein